MSSDFDATDFVDNDYQAGHQVPQGGSGGVNRAPTREEVDSKVGETQQRLAELKRVQEQLERERAALEETRRRQLEFNSGKQEMIHNLTRGVGLLEEAEFNARRDAEQMGKTLADLKEALVKVEFLQEEAWNKDNFSVELTRALTTIENARMEWNAARLKFDILSGKSMEVGDEDEAGAGGANSLFANRSFFELCKLGLAFTWPLAVVASLAFAALLVILSQRH